MKLKTYQQQTIDTLSGFFKEARLRGPEVAFQTITSETDQARRLRGYGGRYLPVPGLAGVPYVCLRLPTGGGKTLLAAHAIAEARDHWMEQDYPVVVWLVPSDSIRRQTVEALKDAPRPTLAQIAHLYPEVRALVEAAAPFAAYMTYESRRTDLDHKGNQLPDDLGVGWIYMTHGDFRRIKAALVPFAEGDKE